MANFLSDEIDFSAYEKETDFKATVRKAKDFAADMEAEFTADPARRRIGMSSTKLRDAIEFRPGETTVWAGYNGHRKSTVTGQTALDLVAHGQRCLMISLEMSPGRTLARMAMQACATDFPSVARRHEFMRWTDGRLWLFNHVGSLTPTKCLGVLRYFASELRGQHVFIDSFMKVCQTEESMDEQKALVGNLCSLAEETGMHLHIIAHCRKPQSGDERPPTKYDIKGTGAITDQMHNVIMVWENKAKRFEADKREPDQKIMSGFDALLTIDKQRNGKVEGKFGLYIDNRCLRFCDSAIMPVDPYDMAHDGT